MGRPAYVTGVLRRYPFEARVEYVINAGGYRLSCTYANSSGAIVCHDLEELENTGMPYPMYFRSARELFKTLPDKIEGIEVMDIKGNVVAKYRNVINDFKGVIR